MARSNQLYLTVIPLIHITPNQVSGFGLTEQVITLFADRKLATEFFPDEAQSYIDTFKNRANKYLTGGHVTGYEVNTEITEDGRIVVRVTQHVTD